MMNKVRKTFMRAEFKSINRQSVSFTKLPIEKFLNNTKTQHIPLTWHMLGSFANLTEVQGNIKKSRFSGHLESLAHLVPEPVQERALIAFP